MKKPLAAAVLCFCAALLHDTGSSQPAATAAAPAIYSYIQARNVPPQLIAWWLDPVHNPEPPEVRYSRGLLEEAQSLRRAEEGVSAAPRARPQGYPASMIPEGIQTVVAVEPRHALLAVGTPEAIAELRKLVEFMDKPLRQVEIEARFVVLTAGAKKALGLGDAADERGAPATTSVTTVRGDFLKTLKDLDVRGLAKTYTPPYAETANNLTVLLTAEVPETVHMRAAADGVFPESDFLLATRLGLIATPTVNNDESITLAMSASLSRGAALLGTGTKDQPRDANRMQISKYGDAIAVANVKDGDTVVLAGFAPVIADGGRFLKPKVEGAGGKAEGDVAEDNGAAATQVELIALVTPRIIRYLDAPTPGAKDVLAVR